MKKLTLTLLIILIGAIIIFAQVPQAFKYQTVVRDNAGELITNQLVSFRIGIIQDSINGMEVYSETNSKTINQFGLVSLEIGSGTNESGVFVDIKWSTFPHFLKIEFDETGNTNYQLIGISQLLSVPYSLNSGSLTLTSSNGTTYEVTVDNNGNLNAGCFPEPTAADVGADQPDICSPTILAGNVPEYGTGTWTVESGTGGIIDQPENPNSQFTGSAGNFYTLRWTIANNCGSTFDEVNVSFLNSPTVANAGPNQVNVPSPTLLAANPPAVGTGQWTIVNGTGGVIAEPGNPTSLFTGLFGSTYTLRWTISTICMSNFDDVTISIENQCPATIADIDGNTYNTVLIGDQCWMAENLKTTTYRNGIPIPNITDNNVWSLLTTGAYAWYGNNIDWKGPYGALYNWFATVDANGLCPSGWHTPTFDEWTALTDFIGGAFSPHGNELKSCRQVNSPLGGGCNTTEHPRWNEDAYDYGTDDYGFSGLPGGNRAYGGGFDAIGIKGVWWQSTEHTSDRAWYRQLNNSYGYLHDNQTYKYYGFSVRCLKD